MKKYAPLLMLVATIALASCGGEEATAEETIVEENTNDMMNSLIEQGVDKAISEAAEQLLDSVSTLNGVMDTVKKVFDDNQDLIDKKVNEGLDALNESLK